MKQKKVRPSFSGLLRIRREMVQSQQSLVQAHARANDKLEQSRIDRVRDELAEILNRLQKQLVAIRMLKRRKRTYEEKIASIDTRIDRLIAPQFRRGERWLRGWKSI